MLMIDAWYDGVLSGFMIENGYIYYIMCQDEDEKTGCRIYFGYRVNDEDILTLVIPQGDYLSRKTPEAGGEWMDYVGNMLKDKEPTLIIDDNCTIEFIAGDKHVSRNKEI